MNNDWQDEANCATTDPELFFPEKGSWNREAKLICAQCPVREQCLFAGLDEEFGIWGGMGARERKRISRGVA